MTGFAVGLWTAARRGRKDGILPEQIMDLGFWLMIGGLLGARTLYVISYWREYFAERPWTEIFMIQHGGLVFYGGLIGSTLACLIYVRIRKINFWKLADALAPSICLGYVFGRIGCLMNGCCYGRPWDAFWCIRFPADHESRGVPVHPTQVYDSLANLVLYGLLAWCYRRKRFDGQIFGLYLICYAVLRSLVEIFRGDYPVRYLGNLLTPAQLISIGIFVAGLVLLVWLRRQPPVLSKADRGL